jgi:hypothetical protein
VFKAVKVLIILWTVLCGGFACVSLVGGAAAIGEADDIVTAEQLMQENTELTQEQADAQVAAVQAGATVGGAGLMGMGVFMSGVVWFIGMIPLLILFLVLKPSEKQTIMIQQVVGSTPASQTETQERD